MRFNPSSPLGGLTSSPPVTRRWDPTHRRVQRHRARRLKALGTLQCLPAGGGHTKRNRCVDEASGCPVRGFSLG